MKIKWEKTFGWAINQWKIISSKFSHSTVIVPQNIQVMVALIVYHYTSTSSQMMGEPYPAGQNHFIIYEDHNLLKGRRAGWETPLIWNLPKIGGCLLGQMLWYVWSNRTASFSVRISTKALLSLSLFRRSENTLKAQSMYGECYMPYPCRHSAAFHTRVSSTDQWVSCINWPMSEPDFASQPCYEIIKWWDNFNG